MKEGMVSHGDPLSLIRRAFNTGVDRGRNLVQAEVARRAREKDFFLDHKLLLRGIKQASLESGIDAIAAEYFGGDRLEARLAVVAKGMQADVRALYTFCSEATVAPGGQENIAVAFFSLPDSFNYTQDHKTQTGFTHEDVQRLELVRDGVRAGLSFLDGNNAKSFSRPTPQLLIRSERTSEGRKTQLEVRNNGITYMLDKVVRQGPHYQVNIGISKFDADMDFPLTASDFKFLQTI